MQAVRAEGGTGMTAAGAATVNPYVEVGPTTQTAGYGWGTYFIVCSLPIVFLANRSIKKDEALVKSLDRLR